MMQTMPWKKFSLLVASVLTLAGIAIAQNMVTVPDDIVSYPDM